jgi:hypothetical protein
MPTELHGGVRPLKGRANSVAWSDLFAEWERWRKDTQDAGLTTLGLALNRRGN